MKFGAFCADQIAKAQKAKKFNDVDFDFVCGICKADDPGKCNIYNVTKNLPPEKQEPPLDIDYWAKPF